MTTSDSRSRTEVARQRLAALAASFDQQLPSRPTAEPPGSHAAESTGLLSLRSLPPNRLRMIVALAVAAGVLLSWWLLSARPRTSEPEAVRLTAQTERSRTSTTGPGLVIDVEGKVKRPGIVTLPRGSRVHEAIAKAGGVVDGADTSAINLARILADGEQVIVGAPAGPAPAGVSPGGGPVAGGPAAGGRISLNSASLDQLDTLPGVGPVTAQAIVDYRTSHGGFRSVDDLLNVKGIGSKTLADLKDQVSP